MIRPGERQTTVRIDGELLRRARYFLDRDGLSMNDLFVQTLEKYLAEREAAADTPFKHPRQPVSAP
jgi:hypothetical protein